MLDYYQNCSVLDCAQLHSILWPFHNFDFAVIFPVTRLFPIPITLGLFVPCMTLFFAMLASFFVVRTGDRSAVRALTDTLAVGLLIVILFESGIYFLNHDWWDVHFSNLTAFPFSSITNFEIAVVSILVLAVIVTGESYEWLRQVAKMGN